MSPAPFVLRALRRYRSAEGRECSGRMSYHDASNPIETLAWPVPKESEEEIDSSLIGHGDPRWPKNCSCGYEFKESDEWQVYDNRLYSGHPSGELKTLRDAPPGAMWTCYWLEPQWSSWTNLPGPPLYVKLPNGQDFDTDGRAANCSMPEEKTHRCWVKHGTPPLVTLDKNGNTCSAGAGSIASNGWHGYLRNGELVE